MPPPDEDRHGGRGLTQTRLSFAQKRHTSKSPPPLARARSSPPATPTRASRQSSQQLLDEENEDHGGLDEATLNAGVAKAALPEDLEELAARYHAYQESHRQPVLQGRTVLRIH
jgi:hypothetical protein